MDKFDIQVERNLKARDLEKAGKVEEAIKLYEANIRENFDGDFPYERLAIIYRKKKDLANELRVLRHAVYVFEKIVHKERADRLPKLNRFKEQLKKAEEKLEEAEKR